LFESDYINHALYTERVDNQRLGKGVIKDKHAGESTEDIKVGDQFTYSEAYNSYDLVANFFVTTRLQFNGSINFSDNFVKQNDSILANVGGIGDLNLMAKYQLYNSTASDDTTNKNRYLHRLSVGGGVSLPTGKYNQYTVSGFVTEFLPNTIIGTPEMELDPHIQPGTGSLGYLFLLEYLIRYNNVGLNTNVSYKINTTNKNEFRLANRFNANGSFFIMGQLSKSLRIMPSFGLSYEVSDYDQINGETYIDSGGEVLFINYGLNLYINKIGVGFNFLAPGMENLHGSQPLNNRRFITQLTYYF
jgi:hypothetical protein